jgi:hypothetical protein
MIGIIDREGVVEIRAWLHHHAILLGQNPLKVPLSLRSFGSCDVSEPKKYGLVSWDPGTGFRQPMVVLI